MESNVTGDLTVSAAAAATTIYKSETSSDVLSSSSVQVPFGLTSQQSLPPPPPSSSSSSIIINTNQQQQMTNVITSNIGSLTTSVPLTSTNITSNSINGTNETLDVKPNIGLLGIDSRNGSTATTAITTTSNIMDANGGRPATNESIANGIGTSNLVNNSSFSSSSSSSTMIGTSSTPSATNTTIPTTTPTTFSSFTSTLSSGLSKASIVAGNSASSAIITTTSITTAATTTASSTTPSVSSATKSNKLQENDKQTLLAIYKLCKRYNFSETVETFKKEVFNQQGLSEQQLVELAESADAETHVSNVLSTYKSEGDPGVYEDSYARLNSFIDSSLDTYRHELSTFIYPVFVHMYLELVYNSHEDQARRFMRRFAFYQEDYYMEDVRRLSVVIQKEQMKGNEIIENFRSGQNLFTVRLSRDSYNYLKRFLNDSANSIVHNIIQEHLYLDIYEGLTRTKQQVECVAGSMMGEATRQANKTKVFYGLLKEPEINVQIVDDDQDENSTGGAGGSGGGPGSNVGGGEGAGPGGGGGGGGVGGGGMGDGDRPKKKKIRKEIISKKSRNDPNAPPLNRIPLPELRDIDKIERINALRESAKRLKLGPNCLPSICFYTLLNANHSQNMAALCVDVSEDSNYIAAGFADSTIIVWPLGATKLRGMKSGSELELIDKEADDVLARMMDDRIKFDQKNLYGHQGPVYSVHFSPDKTLLISCSEDGTIRLWSLQTWTNICSYKGHCFPVWDVKFSPHGYYFASCSHDRTARLWATDTYQPLRVFAGHISDVDCIQFHPNSNYIATGSSDRSVRLWDVLNGQCVRYFTGHKAKIYTLQFTACGKFLVSAGADCSIMFWHLGQGHLVAQLNGHQDTIFSLCFSRDATILATGGNDDRVNLWDAQRLLEEIDVEELNLAQGPVVKSHHDTVLLGSYRTKSTNILNLHFTRKNLLLASGIVH